MNVGLTSIQVKEEVGNVTILINNAGVVTGKPFLNTPDHMVERSFLVNALSHFWVSLHSFSLYYMKMPCVSVNNCSAIYWYMYHL